MREQSPNTECEIILRETKNCDNSANVVRNVVFSYMKPGTLKDVAQQLNLSISTVSRVVNRKGYVKEETRQRVLSCLEACNYVPNEIARSLKVQASMTIGVIVPDICEVFLSRIIKGIDRTVSGAGYMLIVADSNESKQMERRYLDIMFQKRVDALVVATVDLKGPNVERFISHNIPVLFIDNLPQLKDTEANYIIVDNRKASQMAVQTLLDNGHRRIAVIAGSTEETTGCERLGGYTDMLRERGIPVDPSLIVCGNYKTDDGYRCMDQLLRQRELHPFTAIYVTSEMMTIGALRAIREHHLTVGKDLAVIGFDVHDDLGLATPKIATIRQPEVEIGIQSGKLLLQLLDPKRYGAPQRTQIFMQAYFEPGSSINKI